MMKTSERVDLLLDEVKKLSLDSPTRDMLFDLICEVEFATLCYPETIAAEYGLVWENGALKKEASCPF